MIACGTQQYQPQCLLPRNHRSVAVGQHGQDQHRQSVRSRYDRKNRIRTIPSSPRSAKDDMQIVLNGLVSGVIIALLAVAFQAVYLPTKIFFFGLAGIYVVAPYVCHTILAIGVPWPVAVLAGFASAIALSVLMEWASHGRLAKRNAPGAVQLIASLGLSIVAIQAVVLTWGNGTRTLRTGTDLTLQIGPVAVTGSQCATVAVGSAILVGLAIFLKRAKVGIRFVAMSENPVQFALYGYNVGQYRYVGFALAGIFAAAASLLAAYDVGFDPNVGLRAILLAIVAVIVGGQGSFLGPVLGALVLGLVRAEVVWLFSARWQDAATFCLLALFLLLRPQGLLGKRRRLESDI